MARNKKRKDKRVKGLGEDDDHNDNAAAAAAASASASDADEHDTTATRHEAEAQQEAQQEQQEQQQRSDKATSEANVDESAAGNNNNNNNAAATDDDDTTAATTHKRAPVSVLYCPNCTFPAEYCEFSGMYEQCRPWLLEHAAELADAVERGRKRRVLTQHGRLEAMIAGKGVKKALERAVVLETAKVKGGAVTFVTGMDLFGHNLKDLSKEWRKKFSCGGGVRDADEQQKQAAIQMQGSLETPLAELLVSKYQIPKEAIYTMHNKKRVHVY